MSVSLPPLSCACPSMSRRWCIRMRYPRAWDDLEHGASGPDDECECGCHDEFDALEEDAS